MNFGSKLEMTGVRYDNLAKYPGEPEPTRVLAMELPLTTTVADVLKVRDMVYDDKNNERPFKGGFGFDYKLVDVEIKLGTANGALLPLNPKFIGHFRIGHDAQENLVLKFRAHFTGYGSVLDEWSDAINKKEFDCHIVSLQGELFPLDAQGDGAAGGTRVDMSADTGDEDEDDEESPVSEMVANVARAQAGPKEDEDLIAEFGPADGNPCPACASRIPFEDDAKTTHATGPRCKRSEGSSTLSPASLAGGTHQHKRRRDRKVLDIPSEVESELLAN